MNKRAVFAVSAFILVLGFVFAASYYRGSRARTIGTMARQQSTSLIRPHSPVLGAEDAKVAIVMFTDPACETCAAFSPYVKRFLGVYPGKVRLVHRHAPFHEGAPEVAKILEAARRQGAFWETLELLYRTQDAWTHNHQVSVDAVWQVLERAGADVERLRERLEDPEVAAVVAQDLADAMSLGVRKTPGIFVNGRPLEPFGVQPLQALVLSEIRANYPG